MWKKFFSECNPLLIKYHLFNSYHPLFYYLKDILNIEDNLAHGSFYDEFESSPSQHQLGKPLQKGIQRSRSPSAKNQNTPSKKTAKVKTKNPTSLPNNITSLQNLPAKITTTTMPQTTPSTIIFSSSQPIPIVSHNTNNQSTTKFTISPKSSNSNMNLPVKVISCMVLSVLGIHFSISTTPIYMGDKS